MRAKEKPNKTTKQKYASDPGYNITRASETGVSTKLKKACIYVYELPKYCSVSIKEEKHYNLLDLESLWNDQDKFSKKMFYILRTEQLNKTKK